MQFKELKLIKSINKHNKVLIGSIESGCCRHVSILFKYMCDRVGIECSLVRGFYNKGGHAWCKIRIPYKYGYNIYVWDVQLNIIRRCDKTHNKNILSKYNKI